ncbi:sugar kinase [Intrasporangium oryzae NRRL B-24470]|uniref:Sugar kinase n=1 Tax=Intrasporangium oryzae NRRL B-24470 TaxID=1386089 RepID=W9GBY0_9MICO|nr:sugar kinase [Intrasporangium oryzae]EWT01369.1 sugar kinase [Intrasporangium oryzae NRRL B-24470]
MSAGIDVLTFGESMVAFRSDGPLVQGGLQTTRVAGAESNVAIGLARLGHSVAWAGRVGADPFGRLVLRELRAEGVDTTYAVVDVERPTGLMFVEQRTADLTLVEYRRTGSAGSALDPADVGAAVARTRPRLLHLTGITPALSASALECVTSVAESASAAGVLVSLDVNHRNRLWTREQAKEALTPIARRAAYVIASDDELDLVADGTEEEAVASLLAHGVVQVAVKRGPRGASVHTVAGRVDVDAVPVTAVDPIGAGDAFTAGFLSGVLDGLDPGECLRRGAEAGAFAVSAKGDWEGAPTRADLALLHGHRPGATVR